MERMTIICGTGHRPDKLGGYSPETFDRLVALAYDWLMDEEPDAVISGMALGWDQALARAAQMLGIPVKAYIPFIGQGDKWPAASLELYVKLLRGCKEQRLIGKSYTPDAFQRRNEAMVDDSVLVLALWDGSPGGTGNCIRYAGEAGKPVINLWEKFRA